jgi:rare lipoprotein A
LAQPGQKTAALDVRKPAQQATGKIANDTGRKPAARSAGNSAKKPVTRTKLPPPSLSGIASVYYYKKPRRGASGEIIRFNTLVAAHRTFKFGTKVRVTNRRNGKSVVVRIVDRGPYVRGRVIDLSPAAARQIGLGWGLAPVKLAVVGSKA